MSGESSSSNADSIILRQHLLYEDNFEDEGIT